MNNGDSCWSELVRAEFYEGGKKMVLWMWLKKYHRRMSWNGGVRFNVCFC